MWTSKFDHSSITLGCPTLAERPCTVEYANPFRSPEPALERSRQEATGPSRAAFYLALYTGQRKGDVLAMRWDDIENGAETIIQEKGGEELRIPLHPILADELAAMGGKVFFIVLADQTYSLRHHFF